MSTFVLKKGNHVTAALSKDDAQKLVNEGYEVYITKSGEKLEKEDKKVAKKSKAKKVDKKVEEE